MKNFKNNFKIVKGNKPLLLFVFSFFISAFLHSQIPIYYVLVNNQKLNSWCKVDTDFKTFTLSSKIDYKKRNKIIEAFKKQMNSSEYKNVKDTEFYLSKTDYIIVYEYIFKSSDCPTKKHKFIKAFKASTKEKADKILQAKLDNSLKKSDYISHKILLETQPFVGGKTNLLLEAEKLLRDYKKDSIKKSKKATAIGVRG